MHSVDQIAVGQLSAQWMAATGGQAPIGLFEPDDGSVASIQSALAPINCALTRLQDPSARQDPWAAAPFRMVLFNPFRSRIAPERATMLVRSLAGQRPVMALTLTDSAQQRTMAIAMGADDAMCPAGSPTELAARVSSLLRRSLASMGMIHCGELEIDLIHRLVWRAGQVILMPAREFDLLAKLARSPDQPVSRVALLESVWRLNFDPGTNRIEVHMSRLRRRIDDGHLFRMLRTVKGFGYVLCRPPPANQPAASA